MGASSTLRATGLDLMAPGALGAGPEAGGGVSGPVDCATRVAAKKREASGSEKRTSLSGFRQLSKRDSYEERWHVDRSLKIAWWLHGVDEKKNRREEPACRRGLGEVAAAGFGPSASLGIKKASPTTADSAQWRELEASTCDDLAKRARYIVPLLVPRNLLKT